MNAAIRPTITIIAATYSSPFISQAANLKTRLSSHAATITAAIVKISFESFMFLVYHEKVNEK